jgi:hypothetical protein
MSLNRELHHIVLGAEFGETPGVVKGPSEDETKILVEEPIATTPDEVPEDDGGKDSDTWLRRPLRPMAE